MINLKILETLPITTPLDYDPDSIMVLLKNKELQVEFLKLATNCDYDHRNNPMPLLFTFIFKWFIDAFVDDDDNKERLTNISTKFLDILNKIKNASIDKYNEIIEKEMKSCIRDVYEYYEKWRSDGIINYKTHIIQSIYEDHLSYLLIKNETKKMLDIDKIPLLSQLVDSQFKKIEQLKTYQATPTELNYCIDLLEIQINNSNASSDSLDNSPDDPKIINLNKIIEEVQKNSEQNYWDILKGELSQNPPCWLLIKIELYLIQLRLIKILNMDILEDTNPLNYTEVDLNDDMDTINTKVDKIVIENKIKEKLDLKYMYQMMDHYAFDITELGRMIANLGECLKLVDSPENDEKIDLWTINTMRHIEMNRVTWFNEVPTVLNQFLLKIDCLENVIKSYTNINFV